MRSNIKLSKKDNDSQQRVCFNCFSKRNAVINFEQNFKIEKCEEIFFHA